MLVRFTNLPKFEATLQQLADKLEVDASVLVRKMGLDLFSGIVKRTPVDTGWARSSWNISFNIADPSVAPKPAKGSKGEQAVIANNKQLAKLNSGEAHQFPVIWITNNLPYIVPLEAGHSKQIDKGFMVQRTVREVIDDFNRTNAAL